MRTRTNPKPLDPESSIPDERDFDDDDDDDETFLQDSHTHLRTLAGLCRPRAGGESAKRDLS